MIIKVSSDIKQMSTCAVECNRIRVDKIKGNIENVLKCNGYFEELERGVQLKDIVYVRSIVEKIFFEEINDGIIDNIINICQNNSNAEFVRQLKESYKLRGVNGICHAWIPIIKRYL